MEVDGFTYHATLSTEPTSAVTNASNIMDQGSFLFSDDDEAEENNAVNSNAMVDPENPEIVPDSSDEGDLDALEREINEQVPSEDNPPVRSTRSKPDSLKARAIKGYSHGISTAEDSNGTVDPRQLVVAPPTSTSSAVTDVTERLDTQAIERLQNGESTSDGTSVLTVSTSLASSSSRTTPAPPDQHEDSHPPEEPRSDDFIHQMKARDASRPRPRKTVEVRQEKEAERAKSTDSAPTSKSSSSKVTVEAITIAGTSDDEMLLAPNNNTSDLRKTSNSSTKSSTSGSAKKSKPTTKTKDDKKSSKRKIVESGDEDDDGWLAEVQKAQAREEEDDDDFDVKKGGTKDKGNKNKGKGKEPARKNSKGKGKEAKAKPEPKRTKKQYQDKFYSDDTGSEAPTRGSSAGPVPLRRNTPRRGKAAPPAKAVVPDEDETSDATEIAVPKSKAKAAATKQPAKEKKGDKLPRSAEFVDDEDMESDAKDSIDDRKHVPEEKKDKNEPPKDVITVAASVGSSRKPSKTYGKRDKAKQATTTSKKARNIVQSSDEDEGEDNTKESVVLQPLALKGKTASEQASPPEQTAGEVEETPAVTSRPISAASSSSTSSKKTHIEVVIDNTKKKGTTSAPVSQNKKATETQNARKTSVESALSDLPPEDQEFKEQKDEPIAIPAKTAAKPPSSGRSSGKENAKDSTKSASKATKAAPKKRAAVVESEEDESDEDDGADISEAEESDDEDVVKKPKATTKKPDAKAKKAEPESKSKKAEPTKANGKESANNAPKQSSPQKQAPAQALAAKDGNASAKATPVSTKTATSKAVEAKATPTGFLGLVSKFGGGLGVRSSGLSKTKRVPSLLNFIGPAPAKRPPLPPAPVRKPKKGEEVYSDDDMEEKRDQPEEWWDAEDYHAWENRKRKRAKARGELDSDEERELSKKKKSKTSHLDNAISIATPAQAENDEHFSN